MMRCQQGSSLLYESLMKVPLLTDRNIDRRQVTEEPHTARALPWFKQPRTPRTAAALPATLSDAAGHALEATLLDLSTQGALISTSSPPYQAAAYTLTFTVWGLMFTVPLEAIYGIEGGNGEYLWGCRPRLTILQTARLEAIQAVWGLTGIRFRTWPEIWREAQQAQDSDLIAIAETASGATVQATGQACLNAGPGGLAELVALTVGVPKLR